MLVTPSHHWTSLVISLAPLDKFVQIRGAPQSWELIMLWWEWVVWTCVPPSPPHTWPSLATLEWSVDCQVSTSVDQVDRLGSAVLEGQTQLVTVTACTPVHLSLQSPVSPPHSVMRRSVLSHPLSAPQSTPRTLKAPAAGLPSVDVMLGAWPAT